MTGRQRRTNNKIIDIREGSKKIQIESNNYSKK